MYERHSSDTPQVPGTTTHVGVQVYFSRFVLGFLVYTHIAAIAILICLGGVLSYPVFSKYWTTFGFTFFALVSPHLTGLYAYRPIDIISPYFGSYALLLFQCTGIFLLCHGIFRVVKAITLRAFQSVQFIQPI